MAVTGYPDGHGSARETLRSDPETASDPPFDYVQRVNRAINHVLGNLDRPLKLEVVARAACFSPFHFHRVFRALMGETLSHFVKRVRLDRALSMLTHEPGRSLTDIALACGFGSSSDFSRSFRQRYGVPPSAFDIEVFRKERRRTGRRRSPIPGIATCSTVSPRGRTPTASRCSYGACRRAVSPTSACWIRIGRTSSRAPPSD